MPTDKTLPRFKLGRVLATPKALEKLAGFDPILADDLIHRHVTGDPGDLDDEDQAANRRAVHDGSRILSAYTLPDGETKAWVITEADRSVTTILLPEEY